MMSQQPFQKVTKAQKNLFIKIQPPNSPANLEKRTPINIQKHRIDNINVLKSQIKQIKGRIVQSKLALVLSRKQESSPEKLVSSDRMGLVFDHESSKKKMDFVKIDLSKVYQRQDETEREQEPEEDIQIPLHFNSSFEEKDYFTGKNDLEHFQTSRYETSFNENQKYNSTRPDYMNFTDRKVKIQPVRKPIFKIEDFKPKEVTKDRNKLKQRQKEKLNRSLEDRANQQSSLQKYFNQSLERLPKYLNTDRSLSKQRKRPIIVKRQPEKIKIKLNRPSNNKSANGKSSLRPRYQFQIPNIKIDQLQRQNRSQECIQQSSDWDQLKKKVSKYEFVRKYLSESDIFAIYQHLKKNKIKQEKWPLFVVDQASKHMRVHAFK